MSLYETGERAKALRLAISIATSRQVPQVLRLLANDARIQGNADAAIRWHRKIVDLDHLDTQLMGTFLGGMPVQAMRAV